MRHNAAAVSRVGRGGAVAPEYTFMCGRFAAQLPAELIARLFETVGGASNLGPNWNVAPTQPALVVRRHPASGERRLDALNWGLVPHFTRALKTARRPVNARAETVATSGMFAGAFKSRRCIVPADAYYEWRAAADGKQPFAVARADGAPLALAGLWEGWRSADGETLRSFAIVTTAANAAMAGLHDRMPVILEPADWALWLGETPGDAAGLLHASAEGVLRYWAVGRAVNNVRNSGAGLLEPIAAV
jgi:putative SOS response-associated peptidase YedK